MKSRVSAQKRAVRRLRGHAAKIGTPQDKDACERIVAFLLTQMRLAKEHKKEFHLCKGDGFWYWSDSDESHDMALWHGPYWKYRDCLLDAVSPYLVDPSEGGINGADDLHSAAAE